MQLNNKVIKNSVFGLLLIILLLTTLKTSFAITPQVDGNFTVNSTNYILTSSINYSGWLVLEPNSAMNTAGNSLQVSEILIKSNASLTINGGSLQAREIYIQKGASLTVAANSSLFNLFLHNNGTINYVPNFLNVSDLYNNGVINHQNFFNYYQNLPLSYGGSGGGGGTNFGSGATQGYNTRVSGGSIGYNPADPGSEAPSIGNISSPIFNESILSGAAGGNSSCTPGSFGASGFIVSTENFYNSGTIMNLGQDAQTVCYNAQYHGGGGGAGGGGVLEVLYADNYLNNGTYNLNGGSLNSDFDGPWTYGGWGGQGGAGQEVTVKFPYTGYIWNSVNKTENSGGNITSNGSSQNKTSTYQENLTYLNKTVFLLGQEVSNLNNEFFALNYGVSQLYQTNNYFSNEIMNNLTKYFGSISNETDYLIGLTKENSYKISPYNTQAPTLDVLNTSGYYLSEINYSSTNKTFYLNLDKAGPYRLKFSAASGNVYVDLNTTVTSTVMLQTDKLASIPTFLLSTVLFLPFLVYSLIW